MKTLNQDNAIEIICEDPVEPVATKTVPCQTAHKSTSCKKRESPAAQSIGIKSVVAMKRLKKIGPKVMVVKGVSNMSNASSSRIKTTLLKVRKDDPILSQLLLEDPITVAQTVNVPEQQCKFWTGI